jgi:flagellin
LPASERGETILIGDEIEIVIAHDRAVLNKEYQTLVNEIDRQAQGIGLSTGGHFAKSMGVYVGGGTTASGATDSGNGTITLDLSNSVVDSKALGLRTSQLTMQSAAGTNLAVASSTSVGNIVNVNGSGGTAKATFQLSGPGFSAIDISVDLTTSDTTQTVADKLNAAIQGAGNSGTPEAKPPRSEHSGCCRERQQRQRATIHVVPPPSRWLQVPPRRMP